MIGQEIIESEYSKAYEGLEKKGLDHFEIERKLINIAHSNEVNGIQIAVRDAEGRIDRYKKYCGECNSKIERHHFFAEQTNYVCFLWFKCPACGKYSFFSEVFSYFIFFN